MQNGPITDQIQVRKFNFNLEKNKKDVPWFDVAQNLWPLKSSNCQSNQHRQTKRR